MRGKGEKLSTPLQFEKLPALLVNPGVALATRDVFAEFSADDVGKNPLDNVPQSRGALIDWLGHYGNDLTCAALALAPVIGQVLPAMQALPGCRLARMSGSGPTCFGLFNSADEATAAADNLRGKHKDWWIYAG